MTVLRQALQNVRRFDFTMLHHEFDGFLKLRDEIVKRFPHVSSYKEILGQYCKQIEDFKADWVNIEMEIEQLNAAVVHENI